MPTTAIVTRSLMLPHNHAELIVVYVAIAIAINLADDVLDVVSMNVCLLQTLSGAVAHIKPQQLAAT